MKLIYNGVDGAYNFVDGVYYMSYYARDIGKYLGMFIGEQGGRTYRELLVWTTVNSINKIKIRKFVSEHPRLEPPQDILLGELIFEMTETEVLLYLVGETI